MAPPRPSSGTTVKDSLTSRGTPGDESSPARHSEEGVTGKKSDGDEEDNEANGGNGEGVEDNEEDEEKKGQMQVCFHKKKLKKKLSTV